MWVGRACLGRRQLQYQPISQGGFHVWRPQNVRIFGPPPPYLLSAAFVPFVCFLGTPSPHPLRTSYMEDPKRQATRWACRGFYHYYNKGIALAGKRSIPQGEPSLCIVCSQQSVPHCLLSLLEIRLHFFWNVISCKEKVTKSLKSMRKLKKVIM